VRLPWSRRSSAADPYWEAFVNRRPSDPNNVIPHAFKQVQPGGVNPVKTEVHSSNVMAKQVKELAQFYGADWVGIVALSSSESAIVCALRADYDTSVAAGVGGQTPVMKGLFATFTLGAYIRELGYRADSSDVDRDRLAAAAGLVTSRLGTNVYVTDVILTDLPLEPDGRVA
jgi:hypothetical protein